MNTKGVKKAQIASVIVLFLLALSSTIFLFLFTLLYSEADPFNELPYIAFSFFQSITYALLALALLLATGFGIVTAFLNFRKSKKLLLGSVGILLLLGITYLVSKPLPMSFFLRYGISGDISRWVGAGMLTAYVLGVAVVAAALVYEANRWFTR